MALVFLAVPMLVTALAVKLTSVGPILYWSDRVGKNNRLFKMPKFRTMRTNTPAVATHLLGASKEARETNYWLRLLLDSGTIDEIEAKPLLMESKTIINILTSIVKSSGSHHK